MKKSASKAVLIVNVFFIAAILALNYFYQLAGFVFTLKCICSGGFAVLGIINLCYALMNKRSNKSFSLFMAMGLILAFIGDIRIDRNFILGAGAFAAGHICFVTAYCFLQRPRLSDLIPSGILFLGSSAFLQFCPLLFFGLPIYKSVCIVYSLIISLMLGKAIGNLIRQRNKINVTLAVASILFFFSDLMLVFNWFIGLWRWTGNACMGTYYPALCLLAFTIWQSVRECNAAEEI